MSKEINFTNKKASEEFILKHILLTLASKVKHGLCPIACAMVAQNEIISGFFIPHVLELEKSELQQQ